MLVEVRWNESPLPVMGIGLGERKRVGAVLLVPAMGNARSLGLGDRQRVGSCSTRGGGL